MLELYQFPDSPCCMKVRFVLAEKNLDWELRPITTYKFDHYQPEYQKINPHSVVPTLVHDGVTVIQSTVIAEYLDESFPTPPLVPDHSLARAKMREWMAEEQFYLFSLIVTLSFNTMMKLRAQAYGMEQLREWSKLHPDQNRAQDYLQRVSSPADTKSVAAAEKKFTWHMERLDTQLGSSGGPFICGKNFSLADICITPILDRIEYLDRLHLLNSAPRVTAWFDLIKGRAGYQQAAPSFEDRMWGPKKPVPDGGAAA